MVNELIKNEYMPDVVSPPGETLRDILNEQDMSQIELADRTGHTEKHVSEIINAKAAISHQMALELERVLGTPASFWNNREGRYREYLARSKAKQNMEKKSHWLANFPVADMIDNSWLRGFKSKSDQLQELLNFFGIAQPENWEKFWSTETVLYRLSAAFEINPYALSAWLRQGERQALQRETNRFDKQAFKKALGNIRGLTLHPAEMFSIELQNACAECGVAVEYVKQLKGCCVSGAARWLSKRKPLIQLSLRYKKDDHFWFSFFHEAAHILLHSRENIFLDNNEQDDEKNDQDLEDEANEFAASVLIDQEKFHEHFAGKKRISKKEVREFAEAQGIAPGIVVGQLHYHEYWPYQNGQGLKKTLKWPE